MTLNDVLERKRNAIVDDWLVRVLAGYPEQIRRFLLAEKDPFRNPVGSALSRNLPALFDLMVSGASADAITPLLDEVMRIRAVQDFTASQAAGFVFLLKPAVRAHVAGETGSEELREALAELGDRIDQAGLLAFDLFMQCRESLYEIRMREAKRNVSVLERAAAGRARRS